MKRIIFALMASGVTLLSYAQNLVPNPSFEEYLECPYATGELDNQLVDWYSWSYSPDFFHSCSNLINGFAGIPDNAWGYQLPITGDGYAGVYTYQENDPNIREYMAALLEAPLIIDSTYYLMFYASMYDGASKESMWCANSNLGMRFFKDPEYTPFPPNANPLQPDNFAHLNYSEILDDYTNWTLIEGWFTADDAYNWVAIGNFFTDDQTDISILNDEGACFGIYYIENVCVAPTPEECDYLVTNIIYRNKFKASMYPNPATTSVRLNLSTSDYFDLEMYDVQGRLIHRLQDIHSDQEIDVSKFQKGVYVVKVSNNKNFTTIKLIIQ